MSYMKKAFEAQEKQKRNYEKGFSGDILTPEFLANHPLTSNHNNGPMFSKPHTYQVPAKLPPLDKLNLSVRKAK